MNLISNYDLYEQMVSRKMQLEDPKMQDQDQKIEFTHEVAEEKYPRDQVSNFYHMNDDCSNGLLAFHINVGQLSPEKANDFIIRQNDGYKKLFQSLPSGWGVMVIPTRTGETRMEVVMQF